MKVCHGLILVLSHRHSCFGSVGSVVDGQTLHGFIRNHQDITAAIGGPAALSQMFGINVSRGQRSITQNQGLCVLLQAGLQIGHAVDEILSFFQFCGLAACDGAQSSIITVAKNGILIIAVIVVGRLRAYIIQHLSAAA